MSYTSSIWFWEDQSSEQLREMIDALPPFRREKALSYVFDRDRILCAKAYLMLSDMLTEKYGIAERPCFEIGINGKPYLRDIDKYFNLSHCPKGIVCVVGDAELGCDIEEIFPTLDMDMCRACFNDAEMAGIYAAPDPNVEFTRLWTVKEAYLKLTGEGLSDSLPDILSEAVVSQVSFTTALHIEHGCISTIAAYRPR